MSEVYLLDTSALLTLIEDEVGAARVEALFREHEILLPWLCLMEVHYLSQQERGSREADERYAFLRATGAQIVWETSEPVLLSASRYKAKYRLSFADTVIAAFASVMGATLVHKDPEYEALQDELRLEPLPYEK